MVTFRRMSFLLFRTRTFIDLNINSFLFRFVKNVRILNKIEPFCYTNKNYLHFFFSVPDHIRPRVCSLPERPYNPRQSDDLYRLRTFSISKGTVVNCGDSIISRRSRSNTSMNSTNSRYVKLKWSHYFRYLKKKIKFFHHARVTIVLHSLLFILFHSLLPSLLIEVMIICNFFFLRQPLAMPSYDFTFCFFTCALTWFLLSRPVELLTNMRAF